MSLATRAVQWFKGLTNRLVEWEVSQNLPEIDTSFLGDAGPLPISVSPHWARYVGKVILVRETYYKEVIERYTCPVLLVSIDLRKRTLRFQRVILRDGTAIGTNPKKVGPLYDITCQDCQFIADLSHPIN